jgi:hypothetical protein
MTARHETTAREPAGSRQRHFDDDRVRRLCQWTAISNHDLEKADPLGDGKTPRATIANPIPQGQMEHERPGAPSGCGRCVFASSHAPGKGKGGTKRRARNYRENLRAREFQAARSSR